MTEQQIAQLETENQRLTRLVDSLLTYNEQLREENAHLKTYIGINGEGYSNVKNDIGKNSNEYSNLNIDIGISDSIHSNVKNEIGIHGTSISNVKTDIGITKKILPASIEVAEHNVYRLRVVLKKNGFLRVSGMAVRASAMIMLHSYNKQVCSYKELRRITGMKSDAGMAKRIMSMGKKGVICRTGFQRFELTETGKRLMMEAFGVEG